MLNLLCGNIREKIPLILSATGESTILRVAHSIEKNFPRPPKLRNLKYTHIRVAIDDLQKTISPSTLPNKLSDIRWFLKLQEVRRGFIMPSNKEIGLDRRIRTTHTDKSIHEPGKYFIRLSGLPLQSKYDKMIGSRDRQLMILHLQMRFGLRLEEACKFHPGRDVHEKTIDVISGTKITDTQRYSYPHSRPKRPLRPS